MQIPHVPDAKAYSSVGTLGTDDDLYGEPFHRP